MEHCKQHYFKKDSSTSFNDFIQELAGLVIDLISRVGALTNCSPYVNIDLARIPLQDGR